MSRERKDKKKNRVTIVDGFIGDHRTFVHVQGKTDEPFEGPYGFYFEGPRDKDEEMAFNIKNNKIGSIGKMASVPHGGRAPEFTIHDNEMGQIGVFFEERDAINIRNTVEFIPNVSNDDLKAAVLEAIQKLDVTGNASVTENAERLKGSLIERLLSNAADLITVIPVLFSFIGTAH